MAGVVVWITGRPAAGKTTLARAIRQRLANSDVASCLLDSDELRPILAPDAGYDDTGRARFYAALGELAWHLASQGLVVLVAATAARRAFRDVWRARAARLDAPTESPRFLELFVHCDEATCAARDPKGLYAAARRGDIATLPGAQSTYEEPRSPDLTIDTSGTTDRSPADGVERACQLIRDAV